MRAQIMSLKPDEWDQMTDLEEALCNPLLVTDERFDLTRKAAAEIKRLKGLFDKWHTIAAEKHAEIERLEAENRKLRSLTEAALTGLYNGFEPDNQSALYKRIKAALVGKVQP